MCKPHSIGVLFVHGIGSQKKGETLVRFGEPFVVWIKQWFTGTAWAWAHAGMQGRTEQSVDSIERDVGSDTEPATFTMHLSYTGYQQAKIQEAWLFAECHWAESFLRPDTNDVNSWLLLVAPMLVSTHLARQVRMVWKRLWSSDGTLDGVQRNLDTKQRTVLMISKIGTSTHFMVALLLFLASPLIALFTLALLLILRAIGVIPFGPITKFVETAQDIISTVIGDSWIFVSSPLRAAFIDERFRQDLQLLRAKCDEVVVVAHSQGAAIAWRGLSTLFDHGCLGNDVPVFVSLGSGLAKLGHLSKRETKESLRVNYQVIFSFTILWPLLVSSAFLFSGWWFLIVLYITSGGFLGFLAWGWFGSEHDGVLAESQFQGANLKWKDYVSTADPVPNGPLDIEKPATNFQCKEVSNEGSLLADHNAYWTNLDEFVGDVISFISLNTKTRIPLHSITPIDQQVIETASQIRRWQVRLLVLCRWLLRLVSALMLLLPGATQTIGQRLNHWIDLTVGLFDHVKLDAVTGYLGRHSTVGIFSVLVGYLMLNEALTLLFRWGNVSESRRWYFRRTSIRESEFGLGLSVPVGVNVTLLIITMGITSTFWSVVSGFTIAILIAIFATIAFSSINKLPEIADVLGEKSE
jgi:hypothetical protein